MSNPLDNLFGQGNYDKGIQDAYNAAYLRAQAADMRNQVQKKITEHKAQQKALERAHQKQNQDYINQITKAEKQGRGGYLPGGIPPLSLDPTRQLTASEVNNLKPTPYSRGYPELNKKQPQQQHNGLLGSIEHGLSNFGQDLQGIGKAVTNPSNYNHVGKDLVNLFKTPLDVMTGHNDKKALNEIKKTYNNRSNATKETQRAIANIDNSALVGLPKALGNKNLYNSQYNDQRQGAGGLADNTANLVGSLLPFGAGYKVAEKVGLGVKDGAQGLAKLGQMARRGAVAGGLVGAAQGMVNTASGQQNPIQALKTTGEYALMGGIGDPALHGLGKVLAKTPFVKSIFDKFSQGGMSKQELASALEHPQAKQEILSLPAPEQKAINDVLALPEPQIQRYVTAKPADYQQKFNTLISEAQKLQAEGKLPPGREYETLKSMWSSMAGPNDPSFEQLLKLANPSQKMNALKNNHAEQLNLLNKAKQNQKDAVYGNPNNLYNKLNFKQQNKQELGTGGPLQFKKEIMKSNAPLQFKKTIQQDSLGSMKNDLPKSQVSKQQSMNIGPEPQPGLIDTKKPTNTNSLQQVKDINPIQVGTKNIYELADKLPKQQGTELKTTLDTAKQNNIKLQEQLTNDLYNKVVKPLGINKNTKLSATVQDFGEKTLGKNFLRKQGIDPSTVSKEELAKINLEQLKKLEPKKWKDIVKADEYIHNVYNQLITKINEVRAKIYPNNPDKQVPIRQDYYHHFQKLEGFDGLKNLFSTPANIDPHLEGLSPFTKPKAKWQGFMQKRGNGAYHSDAIGGLLKYIQAASHSINIDPVIPVIRNVADQLATATETTKNANNIIKSLVMHANDLSGKTSEYDRLMQLTLGRQGTKIASWLNSRVKKNMIMANLSSAVGQVGNIPLGVAKAKTSSINGLKDTVTQMSKELLDKTLNLNIKKDAPIYKSNFIKERFSNELYTRFDKRLIDQPEKMAGWILETVDKSATRFIWNSLYDQAVKKGIKDPIKYADYQTRDMVAGRGIGEVPLMQKSKTMQIFAPFTLEVGNQWKVLSKMVGAKDAAGIITFLIASYGLNKAVEKIRGSGVSLDPLSAILEGYNKKVGTEKQKLAYAGASLFGEIVGNIPGGNLATNFVNTNSKIPGTNVQFKQLFGDRNPNRFGSGLTMGKALQNPEYAVMPFGANQLRKTLKGAEAIKNKGVYQSNPYIPMTGNTNQLKFPVNTNNPAKDLQMLMFGPNSTSEAQTFYNNKRSKLSNNQTEQFKLAQKSGNGDKYYNNLMNDRKINSITRNIKKIQKDNQLTDKQKQTKLQVLIAELKKYQK